MKLIKESLNFERGRDPMTAMDIGVAAETYAQQMINMENHLTAKKLASTLPKKARDYYTKNYKDWLNHTDAMWGNIREKYDQPGGILTDFDIYVLIYKHFREKAIEYKEQLSNLLILKESFERGQDPISAMNIGKNLYIQQTINFFKTLTKDYHCFPLDFAPHCYYLLDSENNKIGALYDRGINKKLYIYFSNIHNIIISDNFPKGKKKKIPYKDIKFKSRWEIKEYLNFERGQNPMKAMKKWQFS